MASATDVRPIAHRAGTPCPKSPPSAQVAGGDLRRRLGHESAETLERHFPPELPDPDHTTEETGHGAGHAAADPVHDFDHGWSAGVATLRAIGSGKLDSPGAEKPVDALPQRPQGYLGGGGGSALGTALRRCPTRGNACQRLQMT